MTLVFLQPIYIFAPAVPIVGSMTIILVSVFSVFAQTYTVCAVWAQKIVNCFNKLLHLDIK